MKTILIINRHARQMRKQRKQFVLQAKANYPELEIISVQPHKLRRGVARAANEGFERIIVSGGDGTIATAAQVLAKSSIEYGIIPGGTTNAFARALNLPLELDKALDLAMSGQAQPVNLGNVNGYNFISMATLGITEQIASTIPDGLKKAVGRVSYTIWGLIKFIFSKPFVATIKTTEKSYEVTTHQILVASARFHGGKPITPDAGPSKDELVIMSMGTDGSKWQYLKNLILYYSAARHDHSKSIEIVRTQSAKITTKPSKKRIDVDGETLTRTPAQFKLETDAILIVSKPH